VKFALDCVQLYMIVIVYNLSCLLDSVIKVMTMTLCCC